MEEAKKVFLRLKVETSDANKIINWLDDKDVTKYLNESNDEIYSLAELIKNNKTDLLTYYLNQEGRFFLVDKRDGNCIGFLNLFTHIDKKRYEIVIVIGDETNWGQGYGKAVIKECMKEVFLKWRIEELVCKVNKNNDRSIKLFEHLKFIKRTLNDKYFEYQITFNDYLNNISFYNN